MSTGTRCEKVMSSLALMMVSIMTGSAGSKLGAGRSLISMMGTRAFAPSFVGSADAFPTPDTNAAINNAQIADAAIDSAKIANASIVEAKIGTAAVTTAKINDLAVTRVKIQAFNAMSLVSVWMQDGVSSQVTVYHNLGRPVIPVIAWDTPGTSANVLTSIVLVYLDSYSFRFIMYGSVGGVGFTGTVSYGYGYI